MKNSYFLHFFLSHYPPFSSSGLSVTITCVGKPWEMRWSSLAQKGVVILANHDGKKDGIGRLPQTLNLRGAHTPDQSLFPHSNSFNLFFNFSFLIKPVHTNQGLLTLQVDPIHLDHHRGPSTWFDLVVLTWLPHSASPSVPAGFPFWQVLSFSGQRGQAPPFSNGGKSPALVPPCHDAPTLAPESAQSPNPTADLHRTYKQTWVSVSPASWSKTSTRWSSSPQGGDLKLPCHTTAQSINGPVLFCPSSGTDLLCWHCVL